MANELLTDLSAKLKAMKPRIEEQKDMIDALREAGEDTTKLTQNYQQMLNRYNKWLSMLKRRGIS